MGIVSPIYQSFNMAQKVVNLGNKVFTLGKNVAIASGPKLKTAWKYAKVELGPPSLKQIDVAAVALRKGVTSVTSGGFANLTVKDAGLNALVAAEIYFWFILGECLGKRSIIGYDIDGARDWEIHF